MLYKTSNRLGLFYIVQHEEKSIIFSETKKQSLPTLNLLNLITGAKSPLNSMIKNLPQNMDIPVYSQSTNTLFAVGLDSLVYILYAFDFTTGEKIFALDSFERINYMSLGMTDEQLIITGVKDGIQGIWRLNTKSLKIDLVLRKSGVERIQEAIAVKSEHSIYYSITIDRGDIIQLSPNNKENKLPQLNSAAFESYATYANNAEDIYFLSNRTGNNELWFYDASTNQSKQITHLNAAIVVAPVLSHNGKYIAIIYRNKHLNFAILNSQTGEIISNKQVNEFVYPLAWSIDDQFVYASEYLNEKTLHRYHKDTFESKLIKKNSGLIVQENISGKSLITFDFSTNTFIEIDLHTGNYKSVSQAILPLSKLAPGQVMLKNNSVTATQYKNKEMKIYQYPFDGKQKATESNRDYIKKYTHSYSLNKKNGDILVGFVHKKQSTIMRMELKK